MEKDFTSLLYGVAEVEPLFVASFEHLASLGPSLSLNLGLGLDLGGISGVCNQGKSYAYGVFHHDFLYLCF